MRVTLLLLTLFANITVAAQKFYTISGTGNLPDSTKIFFDPEASGDIVYSGLFAGGRFSINIPAAEVLTGLLEIEDYPGSTKIIMVDTSLTVALDTFNLHQSKFSYSPLTRRWEDFYAAYLTRPMDSLTTILDRLNRIEDPVIYEREQLKDMQQYKLINERIEQSVSAYILNNPADYISLYLLIKNGSYSGSSLPLLRRQLRGLQPRFGSHPYYRQAQQYVYQQQQIARMRAVPASFYNAAYTNVQGRPVKLGNVPSPYLLLNFWGSWCVPCIGELPLLKALQQQQGSKLTIIGFANEAASYKDITNLLKVIAGEAITWTNIALLEKKAPALSQMHIQAFPTNVLVHTASRKIVYRGTGAASLQKIIAYLQKN